MIKLVCFFIAVIKLSCTPEETNNKTATFMNVNQFLIEGILVEILFGYFSIN
ncbi:hypothetical protein HBA_0507 [Sodalis endosymbiont of Henestaris halophilus]|nr:hypothetical protein HBA_0507 [Sodalis endosymbiont of Henestaris halophilus]